MGFKISSPGIAAILFVYLFIIFKFVRPRIEDLFERGRRSRMASLDDLFDVPEQLTDRIKDKNFWDNFFRTLIGDFMARFEIQTALFFLLNKKEKKYVLSYYAGEQKPDDEIPEDATLVKLMSQDPSIIYRSSLYTSKKLGNREAILEFFYRNNLDVLLPCLDQEKQLIGFMALGGLPKKSMSVLEFYRVQFQNKLANALMIEDVHDTQMYKHDQVVVSSVKKRIVPRSLRDANGYQIGSFHVDNSEFGVDYFDSVRLDENRIALFMSNSSYSGVDSAIVSLELYSVLHSHTRIYDSPHKILSIMNWVIGSSRFSNKNAPAFCAILSATGELSYSSAGYNPLLVYNANNSSIIECNTKGLPVGADINSKYESKTIQLKPGDAGCLYSEGLVSAVNNAGKSYSIDRLRNILGSAVENSSAGLIKVIENDLRNFLKGEKQERDISVIIFKYQ